MDLGTVQNGSRPNSPQSGPAPGVPLECLQDHSKRKKQATEDKILALQDSLGVRPGGPGGRGVMLDLVAVCQDVDMSPRCLAMKGLSSSINENWQN